MNTEQKNQMLGDLYALRAGMSTISVEKDKLDQSESVYKEALDKVDRERVEYEKHDYDIDRVYRGLSYCNSQLPRGYLAAENDKERKGLNLTIKDTADLWQSWTRTISSYTL